MLFVTLQKDSLKGYQNQLLFFTLPEESLKGYPKSVICHYTRKKLWKVRKIGYLSLYVTRRIYKK